MKVKGFYCNAVLVTLFLSGSLAFGQQTLWNVERIKKEKKRKLFDSLKIHEVKAYRYNYEGGKKSEKGELAEQKTFNGHGQITYEHSTIDPELSYSFAQKCTRDVQYNEDMLTDAGIYTVSAVNGYFEEVYILPEVYRFYTYQKDTLKSVIESYPIDADTSYSAISYAYDVNNLQSVQENVFTTSKKWIVSTSRDLYLNSSIDVSSGGPWIYNYDVIYYYNMFNDVCGISGKNATRPYYKQLIFNKANQVEKMVCYLSGSFKILSKYLFEYDSRGNVVFSDITDAPGHIQIKKKYDDLGHMTEFERIQLDKNKKVPMLDVLRYLHSFYKYDEKGLLNERIDISKTGDTLCKISYVYWFDNNNSEAIAEKVNNKLKDWKVKGKYESTQEFQNRTSEENVKKQSEIFRKEAVNDLGQERYNTAPVKMEYDADSQCFKLTFEELNSLYLFVPRTEAEEFENNADKYTIYTQFEETKDGLKLKSCTVKNKENNREYKSVDK